MQTRFSHFVAIVPGLVLAACASGSGGATSGTPVAAPVAAPTTRSLPVGATGGSRAGIGLEVTTRVEGHTTRLYGPPDGAFSALESAYTELQIPLTRRDDATMTIGNDGLKMRRQLGRIQLRRAFDCGGTAGMPNSETYNITASIISSITRESEGSVIVTTVVEASAENPNYPGSGVRCSSTGTLEDAIAKTTQGRITGTGR